MMYYNTLLKVTRDLRPWQSKVLKASFQRSGQNVITSYNALQRLTTGYNTFRALVTNHKVIQPF